jgi:hypothetical protein
LITLTFLNEKPEDVHAVYSVKMKTYMPVLNTSPVRRKMNEKIGEISSARRNGCFNSFGASLGIKPIRHSVLKRLVRAILTMT